MELSEVEGLPSSFKALGWKVGEAVNSEGSEVQGHPPEHKEFKANVDNVTSSQKKKQKLTK